MKTNKPITMKTSKLTTQAISTTVLLISAWTANAALFFQENFDTIGQAALVSPGAGLTTPLASILPGWAVTANNATQTNVKIGNGIIGGGYSIGAYLATGDGSDFHLSIYTTAPGGVDKMSYSYTNTGLIPLSGIVGSFDFESGWSRLDNTVPGNFRTAGFAKGLTYKINAGSVISLAGTATNVNNSLAATDVEWLSDAQMDAAGLSVRNIGFTLGAAVLNPGDILTLEWDKGTNIGDRKHLAQGIDNLKLGDDNSLAAPVPEPGTALFGIACVGIAAFRRRRNSAV